MALEGSLEKRTGSANSLHCILWLKRTGEEAQPHLEPQLSTVGEQASQEAEVVLGEAESGGWTGNSPGWEGRRQREEGALLEVRNAMCQGSEQAQLRLS